MAGEGGNRGNMSANAEGKDETAGEEGGGDGRVAGSQTSYLVRLGALGDSSES